EETLRLVPVREKPGQDTAGDEVRPAGRESLAGDALRPRESGHGAVVSDGEGRRRDTLPEAAEERRGRGVEARRVQGGKHRVVEETGHRLGSQDARVAARANALAPERADRAMRRLAARLVREIVEPGARRPAGTLRVHRLDHAGGGSRDDGGLVRLDLGEVRRDDGDPLLHDRDVAAEEEPEPPQAVLRSGELGETPGGGGRLEGPRDDLPPDTDA